MDKKNKILFWVLITITLVSIYLTFNRSYITNNYEIIPVSDDIAI